jgi:hypothetical protein
MVMPDHTSAADAAGLRYDRISEAVARRDRVLDRLRFQKKDYYVALRPGPVHKRVAYSPPFEYCSHAATLREVELCAERAWRVEVRHTMALLREDEPAVAA